jgi:hypothetical protein
MPRGWQSLGKTLPKPVISKHSFLKNEKSYHLPVRFNPHFSTKRFDESPLRSICCVSLNLETSQYLIKNQHLIAYLIFWHAICGYKK